MVVAQIVAVAIYNGVILDLPFPKVLWRKMMHVKSEEAEDCAISLNDLEDVDPAITSGLRQMLEFDGDVQARPDRPAPPTHSRADVRKGGRKGRTRSTKRAWWEPLEAARGSTRERGGG